MNRLRADVAATLLAWGLVAAACADAPQAGPRPSPEPTSSGFTVTLATSDGAVDVAAEGSSGWVELGYVYRKDIKHNSSPGYADQPGLLAC